MNTDLASVLTTTCTAEMTSQKTPSGLRTMNIATASSVKGLVQEVAAERGWNTSEIQGEGDMFWLRSQQADATKQATRLHKELTLTKDAAISRILGVEEICDKDTHADIVNIGLKIAPESFSFTPRTWVFPRERSACDQYIAAKAQEGKAPFYICKPSGGNQGANICLIQTLEDIPEALNDEEFVV
jgi:hypothetical protein